MPFDGTPKSPQEMNREGAYAIWRKHADDFSLYGWCKCALGWLGKEEHDEWFFDGCAKRTGYSDGFVAAAHYFGVTRQQAVDLFCPNDSWGKDASLITVEDVIDRLSKMPVTINA